MGKNTEDPTLCARVDSQVSEIPIHTYLKKLGQHHDEQQEERYGSRQSHLLPFLFHISSHFIAIFAQYYI